HELHAFFLGVLHLALRARHVGAVAAVKTLHRLRTLAHRGAHAVHRGVAAAPHDPVLAPGVERPGVEVGHRVAHSTAVGRGEIVEGGDNAGQAHAGGRDVTRLVDAGCEQHRRMTRAQFGERDVAADLAVEHDRYFGIAQQLLAPLHDVLLELEVGDAVDQQAADAVVAIVDRDLVALAPELLGGGKPGRPRAHDADALLPPARGRDRPHPALLPGGVGDVLLDRADGDRLEALFDDAVAFAQPVLRADAAAYFGKVVGRRGELVGLLQPALGGELQP